jgi:hypothetical protein
MKHTRLITICLLLLISSLSNAQQPSFVSDSLDSYIGNETMAHSNYCHQRTEKWSLVKAMSVIKKMIKWMKHFLLLLQFKTIYRTAIAKLDVKKLSLNDRSHNIYPVQVI